MDGDDILDARVRARHADLRGSAGQRGRTGRFRTVHLRLWWAVRPRREIACLVMTPDGAAVLGVARADPGRWQAGSVSDRAVPPMNADEHATLAAWLDFHRATLVGKCEGLDERQLRTASAAPSPLTLLGLLQHAAEVERNWFRRILAGEDLPTVTGEPRPEGHDGGFELRDDVPFDVALGRWRDEVDAARANCAGRPMDATSPFAGTDVTLRWIYVHMIGEYARHIGHADLVRERIDGRTGV